MSWWDTITGTSETSDDHGRLEQLVRTMLDTRGAADLNSSNTIRTPMKEIPIPADRSQQVGTGLPWIPFGGLARVDLRNGRVVAGGDGESEKLMDLPTIRDLGRAFDSGTPKLRSLAIVANQPVTVEIGERTVDVGALEPRTIRNVRFERFTVRARGEPFSIRALASLRNEPTEIPTGSLQTGTGDAAATVGDTWSPPLLMQLPNADELYDTPLYRLPVEARPEQQEIIVGGMENIGITVRNVDDNVANESEAEVKVEGRRNPETGWQTIPGKTTTISIGALDQFDISDNWYQIRLKARATTTDGQAKVFPSVHAE